MLVSRGDQEKQIIKQINTIKSLKIAANIK